MIIKIKQLIFKYENLKKDLIDREKFNDAKLVNAMLADLNKLKETIVITKNKRDL